MRLWNTELSLETTLMFFKSTQIYGNDLNGELISKLAWSPSGLCIAASMEGTLNIYTVQRRQYFYFFFKLFCLLYYLCTDVFQEDETCLSTYTQDAWITAIAWSGISIKNSYNFYPQYLLVGGVDGSVNIAIVDSLNKVMYEKLDNFCRPGGLYKNNVPNVLCLVLLAIFKQNR